MKGYQLGALAVLMVGVLAAGVFAYSHGFRGNEEARQAMAENDYDAFVAATNTSMTREQFEEKSARVKHTFATRDAVQNAIADNDFAAWKDAMSAISTDETHLTQEKFDALVQSYQLRERVKQAVSDNDFTAWKNAMSDMQTLQAKQFTQERFDVIVQHAQDRPQGRQGNFMPHPHGFAGRLARLQ